MIGLSNGYKRLWLLIGLANARVKKLVMPENFLEISRHFALTSCCNTIGQSKDALFHIRVFFGGKTKSPYFDLFIHWLIKQIMNTHRNHFSRSYENRSIICTTTKCVGQLREHLRRSWSGFSPVGEGVIVKDCKQHLTIHLIF